MVIICLAVEIGLRLFVRDTFPPRFFEPHPEFGHFHVPGKNGWQRTNEYQSYVEINSRGLRDREYPYEKPHDVYRILIIGDSFVEGVHVTQGTTYEALLELSLNESQEQRIEILNGGVSRYGTTNALAFLEKEGLQYQPDLVIYAFYPNDVADNTKENLFGLGSVDI